MSRSEIGACTDAPLEKEQSERAPSSLSAGGFVDVVAGWIVGQMVTVVTAGGASITGVPHGVRSLDGVLTLDLDEASLPFSSIRLLSKRS